ncbi:hypothetical protein D3C76_788170 [compost metagenome]
MKARILKKLSKRLAQIAPGIFGDAWIDGSEPCDLAYAQGTSVSGVISVGGGVDYWGEGEAPYTARDWWLVNWCWYGDFESYPDGHQFEGYPDTKGFRSTTINLFRLAAGDKSNG